MTSLGYFLSGEELSAPDTVRCAQIAEAAGFDRAWVSDHFHPWLEEQGESPFVWSVLGGIVSTTGLRMTTAVTCPTFRIHPAIIAQAAATTATLAPGRFTLGIGSGEALNEHILGEAWPPVSIRLQRLKEAVQIIRSLWTGETVTHRDDHFVVHNARLFSLPEVSPDILISGFGPESTRVAADIGDGWISVDADALALQGYRNFGGSGRTQVGTKICWAADETAAAEIAHRRWGHESFGGQVSQDLPMWQGFEALRDQGSPDKAAKIVPCGPDPEPAAAHIQELIDAGFDEVYVGQMGPDQEGGIRFISEHVRPLLRL